MSAIFQNAGLVRSNGKVYLQELPTDALPVGAFNFRGMAISQIGQVLYTNDTGQARTLHSGIAFSQATGIMLAVETPFGDTNVSMGGLLVDSRGAVVLTRTGPDVIHQGVGLKNTGSLTGSIGALVTVPDVIGQTITAARTTITTAGLVVGTEIQQYNDDFAATLVFKQDPEGGKQIESGGAVDLWESLGPFPTPTADPGGPYNGNTFTPVQFDGSASTAGAGATIVQYDWDFGDGKGLQYDLGPTPQYRYAVEDTYTVLLRVTNSFGKQDTQGTTAAIDLAKSIVLHVDADNDQVTYSTPPAVASVVATDGFNYGVFQTSEHNRFQSPSNRPVYNFNANGRLALGVAGQPAHPQPLTVFVVAKCDNIPPITTAEAIVCSNADYTMIGPYFDGNWFAHAKPGTTPVEVFNNNNYDNGWHVFECVFDGADSIFAVDGAEVTGDPGDAGWQGNVIGWSRSTSVPFTGQIAEHRVYPGVIPLGTRITIRNELIAKWITPP